MRAYMFIYLFIGDLYTFLLWTPMGFRELPESYTPVSHLGSLFTYSNV